MTQRLAVICDYCGDECRTGNILFEDGCRIRCYHDYIQIIVGDGQYQHIHTSCLERNLSNLLTRTPDPIAREWLVKVLMGKAKRLLIEPGTGLFLETLDKMMGVDPGAKESQSR